MNEAITNLLSEGPLELFRMHSLVETLPPVIV